MESLFLPARSLAFDVAASELWVGLTKEGGAGMIAAMHMVHARKPRVSGGAIKQAAIPTNVLIGAGLGAAAAGTASGVMFYNSYKQRVGGKSREEIKYENKLQIRRDNQANEGSSASGPISRLGETLDQHFLDSATKWKSKPGVVAGAAAATIGSAGAVAGARMAGRVARYFR